MNVLDVLQSLAHAECAADVMQALTELAGFVMQQHKTGGLDKLSTRASQLVDIIRRVQWQTALYIERCYWALCQTAQQKLSSRTLNVKVPALLMTFLL